MEIRPADLGEEIAKEVIVGRGQGLSNPLFALHYRLFYRKRSRLSPVAVDAVLHRIAKPDLTPMIRLLGSCLLTYGIGCWIGLLILYHAYFINFFFIPSTVYGFTQFGTILGIEIFGFLVLLSLRLALIETRPLQKAFDAPLTEQDAVNMRQISGGDQTLLNYAYLIQEMVRDNKITPAAEPALRDAVRLLGEAVYPLTHTHIPERNTDIKAQEIQATAQKAEQEADPIIKAILLRELEAREETLISATKNTLTKRRNDALLSEMAVQIESLRVGLPNFHNADASQVFHLSERAKAVAREALSYSRASAELDEASLVNLARR